MFGNHSCGDCALKCVDCQSQICPKCLVPCAVGNRCKKCTERFTSHVLKVSPAILLRGAGTAAALGIAWGYVGHYIKYLPLGYLSYLLVFAVSYWAGKLVHRAAAFKLGTRVTLAIIAGLTVGILLSPLRDQIASSITLLDSAGKEDENEVGMHLLMGQIFDLLAIYGGVMVALRGRLK